ncbi:MAG: ParB N-terminal domain-containing protein, partial [Clostridia bacterium]
MKEHTALKLAEIVPYKGNPRSNERAVPAVMESIQQCTYINDIVVDEDNVILAGHTRYKALKRLG